MPCWEEDISVMTVAHILRVIDSFYTRPGLVRCSMYA